MSEEPRSPGAAVSAPESNDQANDQANAPGRSRGSAGAVQRAPWTVDVLEEAGPWPDGVEAAFKAAIGPLRDIVADEASHDDGQEIWAVSGPAELSVVLADDAFVRTLNATHRGQDKPTNVLAFEAARLPGQPGARLLGDVILALETVTREADAQGKSFEHHLMHLFVHGTLHLLGEDHLSTEEAERMEGLERAILARLGIADPYLSQDEEPAAAAGSHSAATDTKQ